MCFVFFPAPPGRYGIDFSLSGKLNEEKQLPSENKLTDFCFATNFVFLWMLTEYVSMKLGIYWLFLCFMQTKCRNDRAQFANVKSTNGKAIPEFILSFGGSSASALNAPRLISHMHLNWPNVSRVYRNLFWTINEVNVFGVSFWFVVQCCSILGGSVRTAQ